MTFKLTKDDRLNKINEGLKLLAKEFDIVLAKQFYHNRSEITVILQK
jgi:23S rRNA C2498 (ribose-2'-O)-methylase RlmM